MKNFKLSLILLTLLFVQCYSKKADPVSDTAKEATKTVQAILDEIKSEFKTGGAVAAVRKSDGTIDYGVIGQSDNTTPLSKEMSLGIGSITKTFTAVLVFKLIEQGQLSLNTTLAEVIPKYLNDNISGEITVEQLLNHSSGLYNPVNDALINEVFSNPSKAFSSEEFLAKVKAPAFEKGTAHGYSNTNYTLLGLIIEQKTGKAYHEYLRATLLDPLKLSSSFLSGKETPNNSITIGHSYGPDGNSLKAFPRDGIESIAWASGSLFCSVADLTLMYQKLLNGELLTNASLTKMKTATKGNEDLNYGYGIFKRIDNGDTNFSHSGQTIAYNSICIYHSKTKSTVVVIVNQIVNDAEQIAIKILEELKE